MPRIKSKSNNGNGVNFSTRHFRDDLKSRLRALCLLRNETMEDTHNRVVAVGLKFCEQQTESAPKVFLIPDFVDEHTVNDAEKDLELNLDFLE